MNNLKYFFPLIILFAVLVTTSCGKKQLRKNHEQENELVNISQAQGDENSYNLVFLHSKKRKITLDKTGSIISSHTKANLGKWFIEGVEKESKIILEFDYTQERMSVSAAHILKPVKVHSFFEIIKRDYRVRISENGIAKDFARAKIYILNNKNPTIKSKIKRKINIKFQDYVDLSALGSESIVKLDTKIGELTIKIKTPQKSRLNKSSELALRKVRSAVFSLDGSKIMLWNSSTVDLSGKPIAQKDEDALSVEIEELKNMSELECFSKECAYTNYFKI